MEPDQITCAHCNRLIPAHEAPLRTAGEDTLWYCDSCWSLTGPHDDGHYVEAPGPGWRRWHILFVPHRRVATASPG